MARRSDWTPGTLKAHVDALRRQDRRHAKELRKTDLRHAKELRAEQQFAIERLAAVYTSDKAQANEWRGTINDLLAVMRGSKIGIQGFVGYIIAAITIVAAGASLFTMLVAKK